MRNFYYTLCLFLLIGIITPINAQVKPDLLISAGSALGGDDKGWKIAYDTDSNIYVTGDFVGTAYFENTPLLSKGSSDIFIAKYNSSGILQWVRIAGGIGSDKANGIVINGTEIYITGSFSGIAIFDTLSITSVGSDDVFIAKYNTNGNIQWLKRAGGDRANGIAIYGDDVYITGLYTGTAIFDTTSITSIGSGDVFLAKYNDNGVVQWVRSAGGTNGDEAKGVAVNSTGVYITGFFRYSVTFDTTDIISGNDADIFLAKYDTVGNFQWARYAGGTNFDQVSSVAVHESNVYITGAYSGTATFDTINITSYGSNDIFLAKYDSGGDFHWVRSAGLNSNDFAYDIAVNDTVVYITGVIGVSAKFDAISVTTIGSSDVFLAKYSSSGDVQWVKNAGGIYGGNTAYGLALIGINIYITGSFKKTATFNTTDITSIEDADIFLAKYDIDGGFIWVKSAGSGGGFDVGSQIACDTNGNIYVTGSFNGKAFLNNTEISSAGDIDIFLAKYNSNGNLQWVRSAGGIGSDVVGGIAINGTDIYITGNYTGVAKFNNINITSVGVQDVFLAKYDSSGTLLWLKSAGGTNSDFSRSVSLNGSDVYITGSFSGTTTFNSTSIVSLGASDVFLAKYNSIGNLLWVKSAGGISTDDAFGVSVNSTGIYVTGIFKGTATFNTTNITASGMEDIFLAKYNSSGILQWVRRAGGTKWDNPYGIAVNGTELYIVGSFVGTATFGSSSITSASSGSRDLFVAKYNSSGTFQWVRRAGNIADEVASGIAVNNTDVYITGFFGDTCLFDTSVIVSAGFEDIFLAKYNSSGDFQWVGRAGGNGDDRASGITINNDKVYITGYFSGNANFNNPSSSVSNLLNSLGDADVFIARYPPPCFIPLPLGNSIQNFCNSATVADLTAIGNDVRWYDSATDGNMLATSTVLMNGVNYYASQFIDGCESMGRLDVSVILNAPNMPIGDSIQEFCNSVTVADLVAIGFDIQCYDDTVGGNLLSSSTMLTNGTNYYISQIIDGCESLNRLKITVIITNPTTNTTTETECDSYFWTQNGQIYTSSGTYTYLNGCHTEELVLTINQVSNNLISVENQIVTANNVNATYQWLDCDNSFAPISDAINQSFITTSNGNYAVELSENGCVDTSACVEVLSIGIKDNSIPQLFTLYPTISNGKYTLESDSIGSIYFITDMKGGLVFSGVIEDKLTQINIEKERDGVYFLRIQNSIIRLVKQ